MREGKRGRAGQPRGPCPPLPHSSHPGCLPDAWGGAQEPEPQGEIAQVLLQPLAATSKGMSELLYLTDFHGFFFHDFVRLFISHVQTFEHQGPPAVGSSAGSPCMTYATHFTSPPLVSICCPNRSSVGSSRNSHPSTPFPCHLGYFNLLSSPLGVSIHLGITAVPCTEHP